MRPTLAMVRYASVTLVYWLLPPAACILYKCYLTKLDLYLMCKD